MLVNKNYPAVNIGLSEHSHEIMQNGVLNSAYIGDSENGTKKFTVPKESNSLNLYISASKPDVTLNITTGCFQFADAGHDL